jgi:hypothetical protein
VKSRSSWDRVSNCTHLPLVAVISLRVGKITR